MNLRSVIADLIQVLPSRARTDWEEPDLLSPDRPTVVLISGFAASHRVLSVMRKRLMRDGFNVIVWSVDWQALTDSLGGYDRMAHRLSSVVLAARKEAGMHRSRIYLVAHSAGGLVARYYVQLFGGWHYCDGLITLATPHRGVWLVLLGLITHLVLKARVLLQMLPGSKFIRRLNAAPFPAGFRMISVASSDYILCPPGTTRLPDSLAREPLVEAVELKGLSHTDFLWSKGCYRLILGYLRPNQELPPLSESETGSFSGE